MAKRAADAQTERMAEAAEIALRLAPIDRQRLQIALTFLEFDTRGILTEAFRGLSSRQMILGRQRSRHHPETGFLTAEQRQQLLLEAATAVARYDDEIRKVDEERKRADAAAKRSAPAAAAAAPCTSCSTSRPKVQRRRCLSGFDGTPDFFCQCHLVSLRLDEGALSPSSYTGRGSTVGADLLHESQFEITCWRRELFAAVLPWPRHPFRGCGRSKSGVSPRKLPVATAPVYGMQFQRCWISRGSEPSASEPFARGDCHLAIRRAKVASDRLLQDGRSARHRRHGSSLRPRPWWTGYGTPMRSRT